RRHTRSDRDWSSDVCSSDLLTCPDPLLRFPPCAYSERMREKFAKPQTLSVVETIDSRLLLRVLTDFRKGDFSARLPVDSTGIAEIGRASCRERGVILGGGVA